MKTYFLAGMFVLLSVIPATSLCSQPQPRLVCAEYFAREVVVEATLINGRIIRDKDDPEGVAAYVYKLHTDRILRGKIGEWFEINDPNTSSRAAFKWRRGRKYLLFLSYSQFEKAWWLDDCGNSGPLTQTKAVLTKIEKISSHHDGGTIYGVVETEGSPLSDVQLETLGNGRRYHSKTNFEGKFKIKVPVGQYRVVSGEHGWSFEEGDRTYENFEKVRIENGGCAQVEIWAKKKTASPKQASPVSK